MEIVRNPSDVESELEDISISSEESDVASVQKSPGKRGSGDPPTTDEYVGYVDENQESCCAGSDAPP